MKKVLFFVAVAAAFTFASCAKDRTCTCVNTSTAPGSTSYTSIVTFTKATKKDARFNCMSSTATTGGYTTTNACTLK